MNPDRWQQISQVYHAALTRDPRDRAGFLREACGGDDALQQEVASLLSNERDAAGFLSDPAFAAAAGIVTHPDGTMLTGRRIGVYQIQTLLGAGGMGEVYRARDTKLGRDVAFKILPRAFTADPDRLARFEREARVLASLNHPHIGAIYGVEESDGVHALVLELVEGETLADRLAKGAVPLDQALRIAIQIASALDTAHRAGIVHRDLKPGNIMLTRSGGASAPPMAKLLDFGLAKASAPAVAGADRSMQPTPPPSLTAPGTILGTCQYMAPEQLEGREADARTDIFAFGAVLYEMLTGKKAFEGTSHASVSAAIMSSDPTPISALQPLTPPALDRVVAACLAKDPDDRWQSARDVLRELKWIAETGMQVSGAAPRATTVRTRARLAWVMAAVATAAALGIGALQFARPRPEPAAAIRFQVSPPAGSSIVGGAAAFSQALSPDGQRVVFGVNTAGGSALAVRSFDAVEAQVLPGTEGGAFPFWSPDSRFIGFFAQGKLKKIDVTGGPPVTLCDARARRGGTWNRDGTIVFAPNLTSGLFRVSAAGGAPAPVTTLDGRQEGTGASLAVVSSRRPALPVRGDAADHHLRRLPGCRGADPVIRVGLSGDLRRRIPAVHSAGDAPGAIVRCGATADHGRIVSRGRKRRSSTRSAPRDLFGIDDGRADVSDWFASPRTHAIDVGRSRRQARWVPLVNRARTATRSCHRTVRAWP